VQLGMALRALLEPSQRQTQLGERRTAFPADQIVGHGREAYYCRAFFAVPDR
jgi:hypothetical protein